MGHLWAAAETKQISRGCAELPPPLSSSSAGNIGLYASPGRLNGTGSGGGARVSQLEGESVLVLPTPTLDHSEIEWEQR